MSSSVKKSSSPYDAARRDAIAMLQAGLGAEAKLSLSDFTAPPNSALGDISFACFSLAKSQKKSPAKVAAELRTKLESRGLIERFEIAGPYINFFFNRRAFIKKVLEAMRKSGENYGRQPVRRGKRMMIEFVSPNTNKPWHLGHIRNALLGEAVARLLEATGAEVVRASLLNDRGIHIMKAMLAYEKWGAGATPQSTGEKGDHFVGRFYVLFEQKAQADKSLIDEAHKWLERWEAGDEAVRVLWQKMTAWVEVGFKETQETLGISFNRVYRESEIYTKGKELIMKGVRKGLFRRDQTGAIIADLRAFGLPEKVLLRSDGTSLYITQDLYLAAQKFKEYKLTRSVYCIGSEQNLYLSQLFAILKLLNFKWADALQHLSYGMVYLPEGKMKSREGLVVDADDLVAELERLVREEVKIRHDFLDETELERRAEAVAASALKYYILEMAPKTDIHFHPEESISFTGKTGPYLLYSYARLASILKKAGTVSAPKKIDTAKLSQETEWALALFLSRYPLVVREAAERLDPSLVAKYAYELAKTVSDFYRDVPVLAAEERARAARLLLVEQVRMVLKNSLFLLGIETVEEM